MQHVLAVRGHGLGADVQLLGDLVGGGALIPFGEKIEDRVDDRFAVALTSLAAPVVGRQAAGGRIGEDIGAGRNHRQRP